MSLRARGASDFAEECRRDRSRLDRTWEGRARDRFFDSFSPLANRLDEVVEELEAKARQIESKTVTIRETVWAPRYEPR